VQANLVVTCVGGGGFDSQRQAIGVGEHMAFTTHFGTIGRIGNGMRPPNGPPAPIATEQATQSVSGKRYLDDFKRDVVRLVTEERYRFQAEATAVGVSQKSLRDWHAKFALFDIIHSHQ
jgi:transposase